MQILAWVFVLFVSSVAYNAGRQDQWLIAIVYALATIAALPPLWKPGALLGQIDLTRHQRIGLRMGAGALFLLGMLIAPKAPSTAAASADAPGPKPTEAKVVSYADRIEKDAIASYTEADRKHYPKLFAKLGDRIFDVGDLAQQAARLALDSGQCDKVVMADVSERATRQELHFYVDCANQARVRVSEADIKAKKATNIRTKDDIDAGIQLDAKLVETAKETVRSNLRDKDSGEFRGVFVSRKEGLAVCGEVSAKNGFGGFSGFQPWIMSEKIGLLFAEQTDNFQAKWRRYCSAV